MIRCRNSLLPFFLLAAFLSISAEDCNRTCGHNPVPYPFGFSPGCPIRLNCSKTGAILGGYSVRNITQDRIIVDIPADCNRGVGSVQSLFGNNYAMTSRNGLFLLNCTSSFSACLISAELISERLDLKNCGDKGANISCYSDGRMDGYLSAKNISKIKCKSLFISVWYTGANANEPELQFGRAELEWWMNGECRCSANASCSYPKNSVPGKRYTCACHEGFTGDGFHAGDGCKKVHQPSGCSASDYVSGRCARIGALVGGIVAGASAVFGVALLFRIYHCRRPTSKKNLESARLLLSEASCIIPVYSYRDIERATNHFSDANRLGTGGYGTVYVGKLPSNEIVAVKRIRNRDTDSMDQVTNEIKLISSVNHPNLVRLLGCCIERGERILVYEFMPNGTLSQHLHGERGEGLSWTLRLSIASETANAIAHLHSAVHPPIYHRDIKSSNILLDHNFRAKVADFGLSRIGITESSHISTAPQGTPGYLDPQYHQDFHLSDKSDVYSFGVVLVEMITAMKVVDFGRAGTEVNLAAFATDRIGKGRTEEIIDPFIKVNADEWTLSSIRKAAELAFRCLAFHKDVRPSMMEAVEELEMIRSGELDGGIEMAPLGKSRRLVLVSVMKVDSPVSVQDAWLSEQSSPSTNGSLGCTVNR